MHQAPSRHPPWPHSFRMPRAHPVNGLASTRCSHRIAVLEEQRLGPQRVGSSDECDGVSLGKGDPQKFAETERLERVDVGRSSEGMRFRMIGEEELGAAPRVSRTQARHRAQRLSPVEPVAKQWFAMSPLRPRLTRCGRSGPEEPEEPGRRQPLSIFRRTVCRMPPLR